MKKVLLVILLLAPMAVMAQKFGHVNTQDIIQAMPDYTKAKSEIDALQKQYEADLKSMQDELTKKSQDYEANEKTFPENIKQRRQQELQDTTKMIAPENAQLVYDAGQNAFSLRNGEQGTIIVKDCCGIMGLNQKDLENQGFPA